MSIIIDAGLRGVEATCDSAATLVYLSSKTHLAFCLHTLFVKEAVRDG
jgi:hypothetical protein